VHLFNATQHENDELQVVITVGVDNTFNPRGISISSDNLVVFYAPLAVPRAKIHFTSFPQDITPEERSWLAQDWTPPTSVSLVTPGVYNFTSDESSYGLIKVIRDDTPDDHTSITDSTESKESKNFYVTLLSIHSDCMRQNGRAISIASLLVPSDVAIQDAFEAAGISLPVASIRGACSTTAARVLAGSVTSVNKFIEPGQTADGFVLLDVAYASSDATVAVCIENEVLELV